MILSDLAIRRPVFTTMMIAAIVVLGLISFREIGVDLFPRVELPTITIVSVLPGADPETVETTVTDPIEEAVATIAGIKHLRSTSADEVSQVIVEFVLEKDIDVAYQEIQAKLGTVRSDLPDDLEEPVVEKFDVDSTPIMSVVMAGPMPIRELTRLADDVVKERLQRVPNVGQVKIVGGRDRKIWLWLDRDRLEGYGLSVQDVEAALLSEHVEEPGGRIESGPRELVVKTKAEFETPAEFGEMVVAYRSGAPIRVRDVGLVEDGMEEERSLARLGPDRAVALQVRRQSGTNTVEVAHAVKREVEALRAELEPRGVSLEIAQDLSVFIEHSVHEVQFHLVFGGSLAILIVLVFLRNWRSTFIASLVIPTSVIGTFILMNALGFTQNMMTLLALSLAIGLLIDDAIVVQENIMRHVEAGMERREAARFATSEIALAVLATTLSAVAVFVPVAFMKGIVGRFFFQFGLTVAFAVMISMFVSFTLDPMLSSRILKPTGHGRFVRLTEIPFVAAERAYAATIRFALRRRWVVVLLAVASFVSAGYVARFVRNEFVPLEDQSEFNVKVKAPLGSSLTATNGILERIEALLRGKSWVEYTFATIGEGELQRVNEGTLYVKMLEKGARELSQQAAMEWMRAEVAAVDGAKVSVEVVPRVAGGGQKWADLQLEIRGRDLAVLEGIAADVLARMRESEGYVDLDTTYEKGKPEVDVRVARERASDLAVSPSAIASTIRSLVGGEDVSQYESEGDRYDVGVRLQDAQRSRAEDIFRLSVRNARGDLVSMRNVMRLETVAGPVQIDRFNRSRQITVVANLEREKKVLGEAVAELGAFLREKDLPPGYSFGFAGQADTMAESFRYLLFALGLAVVFVYMVLAAQFESFVHPFTIMVTLPLSLVGALGALVATGETMSIFTMIGVIMLFGLVTKNGILVVDFANALRGREPGLSARDAMLRAGPVRLRPILMTTFALVFGMLPIALGTGAGSESRAPMAIAVIGGLATSTLLTLVVVPVVYTLLDDLGHPSRWRLFSRRGAAASAGS